MNMTHYEEHIRDSAADNSRWDGFDRGDLGRDNHRDQGMRVIGRMTDSHGYRVTIVEVWDEDMKDFWVAVNGRRVHATDDRANAIIVARWWWSGCPA